MEPGAAGSGERRGRGCRMRRSTIVARRRRTSRNSALCRSQADRGQGRWRVRSPHGRAARLPL